MKANRLFEYARLRAGQPFRLPPFANRSAQIHSLSPRRHPPRWRYGKGPQPGRLSTPRPRRHSAARRLCSWDDPFDGWIFFCTKAIGYCNGNRLLLQLRVNCVGGHPAKDQKSLNTPRFATCSTLPCRCRASQCGGDRRSELQDQMVDSTKTETTLVSLVYFCKMGLSREMTLCTEVHSARHAVRAVQPIIEASHDGCRFSLLSGQ
jgi:hypothetical protein